MRRLTAEYARLRERDFKLEFVYPTKPEREKLMIVHREMTTKELSRVQSRKKI